MARTERGKWTLGWCSGLLWWVATAILLGVPSLGRAAESDAIKAAFLYRFAQYCEWPEGSFPSSESALVIGVVGADRVRKSLEETVAGKVVQGREIQVVELSAKGFPQCHILFLGGDLGEDELGMLKRCRGRAILTVGDADKFPLEGGMIGLSLDSRKDRLIVNLTAAESAHLKLNSQLLKVARVIRPAPQTQP